MRLSDNPQPRDNGGVITALIILNEDSQRGHILELQKLQRGEGVLLQEKEC